MVAVAIEAPLAIPFAIIEIVVAVVVTTAVRTQARLPMAAHCPLGVDAARR
jgi:hypothetical protein